jgi:hypothetical protein
LPLSTPLTPKIAVNPAIYGTIAGCNTLPSASSPQAPYYVRGNKWNNLCTFTSSDYSLTKLIGASNTACHFPNTSPLLMDNGPQRAIYQCGMPPNPMGCVICPSYCTYESIIQSCPTCPPINTPDFANVKFNKAVKIGLDKMNSSDVDKYRTAVNLFSQIAKTSIASPTAADQYLLDIAYQKNIESLGAAIRDKQITCGNNSTSLTQEVKMVEEVQNTLIAKYKKAQDYYPMLYATMEKAQTYRVANRRDLAIAVFNSISTWAQPEDMQYVQERKCMIEIEQQVLSGQMKKEDAASAMENCIAASPVRFSNPSYENMNSTMEKVQLPSDNTILITPNPNNGLFNVDLSELLELNGGEFELYDLTGTKQFSYTFHEGRNKFTIFASKLSNGVYFCRLLANGKIIYQNKMVIIHD